MGLKQPDDSIFGLVEKVLFQQGRQRFGIADGSAEVGDVVAVVLVNSNKNSQVTNRS